MLLLKKKIEILTNVRIKRHVELLWEEFKLPIWVTEFDWNANNVVDMGDHTVHAEQIHKFYKLMFSLEVVSRNTARTSHIFMNRLCTAY